MFHRCVWAFIIAIFLGSSVTAQNPLIRNVPTFAQIRKVNSARKSVDLIVIKYGFVKELVPTGEASIKNPIENYKISFRPGMSETEQSISLLEYSPFKGNGKPIPLKTALRSLKKGDSVVLFSGPIDAFTFEMIHDETVVLIQTVAKSTKKQEKAKPEPLPESNNNPPLPKRYDVRSIRDGRILSPILPTAFPTQFYRVDSTDSQGESIFVDFHRYIPVTESVTVVHSVRGKRVASQEIRTRYFWGKEMVPYSLRDYQTYNGKGKKLSSQSALRQIEKHNLVLIMSVPPGEEVFDVIDDRMIVLSPK